MLALPEVVFVVGVKVAVYTFGSAVTVGVPKVPPVTKTSAAANPVGASLKVKVMVAVSPALTALTLLVMASVGARVSMLMAGVVPAPPLLPAASV